MADSRLKMNLDKSEVIRLHACAATRIWNDTISATDKARFIGVLISDDLLLTSMWRKSAVSAF